jgi:glutamate synthase domain-containing protein 3
MNKAMLLYFRNDVFPAKCNMESVNLYPLNLQEDQDLVKDLLIEFKGKTGSELAGHILDNWEKERTHFVKVSFVN